MINLLEKRNFSGYTFIVPSVSVGNIGQLTTDLLISSLGMKKIGALWDPSIIPIIGPPAYEHDTRLTKPNNDHKDDTTLTTASDLYFSEKQKLLVLQIRSPIVATLMESLFEKLTDFLIQEQIDRLIIMTGSFAYERHNIEGNLNQYVANEQFLLKYQATLEKADATQYTEEEIPGGGFAIPLYKATTSRKLATIILFRYVSEGDNIPDAHEMIKSFNEQFDVLELRHGKLRVVPPVSWKHLFGNEAPPNMY